MTQARLRANPMGLCVALVALASAGLLAQTGPAGNLVKNPGFEQLDADGKRPLAWGGPGGRGVRSATDPEVARSGKRSGRIEGLDAGKQSRLVQA